MPPRMGYLLFGKVEVRHWWFVAVVVVEKENEFGVESEKIRGVCVGEREMMMMMMMMMISPVLTQSHTGP